MKSRFRSLENRKVPHIVWSKVDKRWYARGPRYGGPGAQTDIKKFADAADFCVLHLNVKVRPDA